MQIGVTDIKPTLKASTFASRTSPSTDQSLQKSLLCQRREKLFLKNFLPFKKNKKRNTQPDTDRQITVAMQTPKPLTVKRSNTRRTEGQLITFSRVDEKASKKSPSEEGLFCSIRC